MCASLTCDLERSSVHLYPHSLWTFYCLLQPTKKPKKPLFVLTEAEPFTDADRALLPPEIFAEVAAAVKDNPVAADADEEVGVEDPRWCVDCALNGEQCSFKGNSSTCEKCKTGHKKCRKVIYT